MWLLLALGCPWISPADHRRNQKDLDGDADTDADSDADTDSETGGCSDDAFEENDDPATPAAVALGLTEGVLCPGDADHFATSVTDGLTSFRASIACGGSAEVALRVWRDGILLQTAFGECPEVSVGMGVGEYVVGVLSPAAGPVDYALTLEAPVCDDADGDDQTALACGGSDCNDGDANVFRGQTEVPANGFDEDCDGADDLANGATCVPGTSNTFDTRTLACGEWDFEPVWDHWTFRNVASGAPLTIWLTQPAAATERADLFALYLDAGGRYGLDAGRTALDEDATCQNADLGQCPGACPTGQGGTTDLWVAQRACAGPVDYELHLDPLPRAADVNVVSGVPGPF